MTSTTPASLTRRPQHLLLVSLLAATLGLSPLLASAQERPGDARDAHRPPAGAHEEGPHLPPPMLMPGAELPPPFARLDLTTEQEDRIFTLFHNQAPAIHQASQRLRQAQRDIHALLMTPEPDVAKLRTLSDAAAKAESDLHVLQISTDLEARRLLTPAQREQMEKMRPPFPPFAREGSGPHSEHGGQHGDCADRPRS